MSYPTKLNKERAKMTNETNTEKIIYTEDAFYSYVKKSDKDANNYDQFLDRLLDEISIT